MILRIVPQAVLSCALRSGNSSLRSRDRFRATHRPPLQAPRFCSSGIATTIVELDSIPNRSQLGCEQREATAADGDH